MKKPSQQDIQSSMEQVPRLYSPVAFEEVIAWVYSAPNPKARFWLWRWLDRLIS